VVTGDTGDKADGFALPSHLLHGAERNNNTVGARAISDDSSLITVTMLLLMTLVSLVSGVIDRSGLPPQYLEAIRKRGTAPPGRNGSRPAALIAKC
jgi:hypothetical protein